MNASPTLAMFPPFGQAGAQAATSFTNPAAVQSARNDTRSINPLNMVDDEPQAAASRMGAYRAVLDDPSAWLVATIGLAIAAGWYSGIGGD